ncbi:U-box domain-containing protein 35-like [Prosopis cineraria]|uniref:U-box domain-containing protein 35-like n=1 Tax=Prosopis cineraria TaxID=364024 RepID=UPI002410084A|nr:U-box domain-containing protein 35-like [Prosopis cineraria]
MSTILSEPIQCRQYSDEAMNHDGNAQMFSQGGVGGGGGLWEIEEERSSELQENHRGSWAAASAVGVDEDCVYVGVGKSETSMEALSWTLKHLIASPSTMVYLIHVFPEIKHIPNPLGMGMIPKNQVSAEQVESYEAQERAKRRQLLHKFLQLCSSSQVKVDTILIESDTVAKAILDLIPILNIQNLVIGTNKSNLRKSRSRRGNSGIADQILQNSPESCRVRIISEAKEVNEQMLTIMSPSPHAPSPRPTNGANNNEDDDQMTRSSMSMKEQDRQNSPVSCNCFKPMFR